MKGGLSVTWWWYTSLFRAPHHQFEQHFQHARYMYGRKHEGRARAPNLMQPVYLGTLVVGESGVYPQCPLHASSSGPKPVDSYFP